VPSCRLFEFLDDMGNYIKDPKLRRAVGASSGSFCSNHAPKGFVCFNPSSSNPSCGGVSNKETHEIEQIGEEERRYNPRNVCFFVRLHVSCILGYLAISFL